MQLRQHVEECLEIPAEDEEMLRDYIEGIIMKQAIEAKINYANYFYEKVPLFAFRSPSIQKKLNFCGKKQKSSLKIPNYSNYLQPKWES